MYLDYFSLERLPFRITPDTSLFFPGGNQGRGVVLDAMLFAIESGEGILKVVGEVGSGKTMLCRMLEERLPQTTEIVYLANPRLSPDEILYAIAFELKLPVRRDTSKLLVMQKLQNYLIKQHTANRRVLIIIEEAQGMSVETLEEIRLFSNLETQVDKLMQIILFGQPELDKNLSSKNIRQLRERITHSFHLNPLNRQEVSEYVRFRLGAAGCPCPQLLTRRAEWLLTRASGGLTRRINILVDKALLAGFAENVLESNSINAGTSPVITGRHIWAAICDSEYLTSSLHSVFSPLRVASAGMAAALVAVAIMMWPESTSVSSQTHVLGSGSGTLQSSQPAVSLAAVSILAQQDEQLQPQKPQHSPMLEEAAINPLAIEVSEIPRSGNAYSAGHSGEASDGLATPSLEQNVLLETSLIEGFVQPRWVSGLDVKPAAQQLRPAELDFGRSNEGVQLRSRVLASIDWLRNSGGVGYTVQFMSGETRNLDFAESFLQVLHEHDLATQSYVCLSNTGGRSYWTIKYGNFDGISLAQKFIDTLPASIFEYKPFVQNMSTVECDTNNSIAALILE